VKYNAPTFGGSLENLQEQAIKEDLAPSQQNGEWKQFALDLLETLVLAALLFLGINAISARVRVDGTSMRPSLQDGEFVLVSKLSYRFGTVERGDIIVFHDKLDPTQELIKRVIGKPGDVIKVENGNVTVNGQTLQEPYIAAAPIYSGEWTVPDGNLFVLGDNRNASSDSHIWNFLPMENIVGKAVVIYWPPALWEVIQHEKLLRTE